jgi:hypothetical protein
MFQFIEKKFYNPGLLEADMPSETFENLSSFCSSQIENKDANYKMKRALFTDNLVSGIEEAIYVNTPALYKEFILEFSKKYVEYFDVEMYKNTKPVISDSWINLQKKYEYRPVHNHDSSSDLSFVTYIKIPFSRNEEDNYPNHFRSKIFRNGKIEFVYNGLDGKQHRKQFDIDETYEGKTLLFSSSLLHVVYPFYTSSEYRISLAGNIKFN